MYSLRPNTAMSAAHNAVLQPRLMGRKPGVHRVCIEGEIRERETTRTVQR